MNILANILGSTLIFAAPLLLVAMGGMFAERSGVINIALEGIMIFGALVSCLSLNYMDKIGLANQVGVLVAILIAGISGMLFSFLLAFAAIKLKADQTIGGTALNILAPAIMVIVAWRLQGQGNTSISIPGWVKIGGITAESGFFERMFMRSFYLTTPITLVLFFLGYFVMYKTRFGLQLRSCGEHPQASDSVGINVYKMRYIGTLISGFLAGIGGLAFVVAAGSGFDGNVGGYGFLGLAVMIFGNWQPFRILGASLFFAFFKVIGSYASNIPFLPSFTGVKNSSYIYQMIPYIATMVLLCFTSKKSRAPKAEGIPYDKGAR